MRKWALRKVQKLVGFLENESDVEIDLNTEELSECDEMISNGEEGIEPSEAEYGRFDDSETDMETDMEKTGEVCENTPDL